MVSNVAVQSSGENRGPVGRSPDREELAPAKLNLFLEVLGRRKDGYHEIDSFVTFLDITDRLTLSPADDISISVTGPFAGHVPVGQSNLVYRAVSRLREEGRIAAGAAIRLDKNIPAGAGLGGGSADAAAALRAARRLWSLKLDDAKLADIALDLGADVPVCLAGRASRMQGIGEMVTPIEALPMLDVVVVYPGVAVATKDVYGGLRLGATPGSGDGTADFPPHARGLIDFLKRRRNDLEAPACAIAPEIDKALEILAAAPQCQLARMTGSGSACFGIFPDDTAARSAATRIGAEAPQWWVRAARCTA